MIPLAKQWCFTCSVLEFPVVDAHVYTAIPVNHSRDHTSGPQTMDITEGANLTVTPFILMFFDVLRSLRLSVQ